MTAYEISIDNRPSETDMHTLIQNLVSYNDTQVEVENWQRIDIFIRDERGEMVGGLCGYTHWGWLFISHLWLTESIRGQNYGKELVTRAERQAAKRGCHHAYLDTYDFQALGFYRKLGYEVFGSLENFPTGHTRYFLQKDFL